jgi:hypothetical protein
MNNYYEDTGSQKTQTLKPKVKVMAGIEPSVQQPSLPPAKPMVTAPFAADNSATNGIQKYDLTANAPKIPTVANGFEPKNAPVVPSNSPAAVPTIKGQTLFQEPTTTPISATNPAAINAKPYDFSIGNKNLPAYDLAAKSPTLPPNTQTVPTMQPSVGRIPSTTSTIQPAGTGTPYNLAENAANASVKATTPPPVTPQPSMTETMTGSGYKPTMAQKMGLGSVPPTVTPSYGDATNPQKTPLGNVKNFLKGGAIAAVGNAYNNAQIESGLTDKQATPLSTLGTGLRVGAKLIQDGAGVMLSTPAGQGFTNNVSGAISNTVGNQIEKLNAPLNQTAQQPIPTQPLRDVKVPAFSTPTNPVPNANPMMDNRPAPQQYAPKLSNPNQEGLASGNLGAGAAQVKMPTSMNDVTSGTGFIKASGSSSWASHNPAFDNGIGFVQNADGVKLSNGKQLNTGHPAPLEQQAKEKIQHMAINGSLPAAQQLTQEAQQQALGQYQQGTLANQKSAQDAANEQTQYGRNTSTAKFEEAKAASQNASFQQMTPEKQAAYLNPPKWGKMSRSIDNGVDGKRTEEVVFNEKDPTQQFAPVGFPPAKTDAKAPKKGESLAGITRDDESKIPVGQDLPDTETGLARYKKIGENSYHDMVTGKTVHGFKPD